MIAAKLGINPESGLAAVLQNGLEWRGKLVKLVELPDLDILPSGFSSRHAADLIGARLPRILEEAAPDYDLIVIRAPIMRAAPGPTGEGTSQAGFFQASPAGL